MDSSSTTPLSTNASPLRWSLIGIISLVIVVGVLSVRLSSLMVIPGDPQGSHAVGKNGLADFQDVIYYPLQAVREGVNPYDCGTSPLPDGSPRYRQRYPVLNLFPLYSPLIFILSWPWGFGDFTTSAVLFVAFNLLLLLCFSYQCWRCAEIRPSVGQITILASCMLATQAGRANFLGGDTALALASLGAVQLAPHRPWLAGLLLALTSFKPTFGLPLGILLLACGYYRTVAVGWTLGFVVGMAGLVIIFARSGDLQRMPEILIHNQEVLESDPDANALTTAIRVDSASALERLAPIHGTPVKLAASAIVLGIACWALFGLRKVQSHPEANALMTAIVALTTVSSIYHVTYDAMLVWGSIAGMALAARSLWPNTPIRWRWLVGALLLMPMVNVLGTNMAISLQSKWFPWLGTLPVSWRDFGWLCICTLNGLSLLVALVLMAIRAQRLSHTLEVASDSK
jgi:Glycosyltransferase family 87